MYFLFGALGKAAQKHPRLALNADTLHLGVANVLDDWAQAGHTQSGKVFVGCKAFRTETGIWCG